MEVARQVTYTVTDTGKSEGQIRKSCGAHLHAGIPD